MTATPSATEHRDLRTGRSLWLDRRRPPLVIETLDKALSCELLVIGAGISGALIAEQMSDAGLDVAIVDRRGPVKGSTAASTAMLQYELDTPLSLMSARIGRARAEAIWKRSRLAVDALRERTERLGLADMVEGATRPSLYLDGTILDARGLAKEADARRRAGFDVALLPPAEVEARFGIRGRHALLGDGNYTADPRQMAAAFLQVAQKRGARLFAPVDIIDIRPDAHGVTLATGGRPDIRARHVIVATGYERLKSIPRKGNRIISSWSIATRPQPGAIWPGAALIWEASDPYLYIRTTPHGTIICGGEDEEFADEARRDALIDEKAARLSEKLAALLPQIDAAPTYAWAGSFGNSPVGTPTVGRIPRLPHCYAAMGYGGNGITFSMMAAQILRGAIMGYGDSDAPLFSFHRKF
ncbi:NAD(P)/FAD-dependent oxidoreductase [Sphingopyxis sp. MWB1]|uniref:NAD(P)/FAD-dependent oxidoreductase n=1 Tax=Sphingopyxis sp. MWB1 TaxID=1537715 RepID=UPI00051A370B|nr:FAD-binding oxidoreductase [Sphingopyxis sp. MWB1]